jgi:AcrR family transcriptional regulator
VHVGDLQRSRLLAAAVGAVEEFGYVDTTVARITARARVSRRTFYELFGNREECLVAVLDGAVGQIAAEISGVGLDGLCWRERVRVGLWVLLSFFDREPVLARVCVVESQRAGGLVLERREEILSSLASIVEQGREECSGSNPGVLTAEGVVGAVLAILHARLSATEGSGVNGVEGSGANGSGVGRGSLRGLLNELMVIVLLPYAGVGVARREYVRALPPPVSVLPAVEERLTATLGSVEPLAEIPMRLTYRTARVLQDLSEYPGSSNREVSDRVGIHDQGQMSKLLARLQRFGLLTNNAVGGQGKGEPNEWALTLTGEKLTRSITAHTTNHTRLAS